MKLLRLYIQGSGIFNRTLIDFTNEGKPQDILCLAGVNGSGKTTIMELLFHLVTLLDPNLSLQSIFFDQLKPHILTRTKFAQLDILIDEQVLSIVVGEKSNIVRDENHPATQAFVIESEIGSHVSRFENAVVKTPEDEESKENIFNIKIRGVRDAERFSERHFEKLNVDIFQELLKRIETALSDENQTQREGEGLPSIYSFNTHDREIQDIRYSFIPKEKSRYQLARRYHPRRDDLNKTLVYYDYAYPQKFEALKNWINQYVLVDKRIVGIDRTIYKAEICTKNGGTHGLELLSSGEESLLIIATQIYLKVSRGSVVVIDEVDESLHPEFQEKIMALLTQLQKDKGCQIIVSSHSDIVWKCFDSKGLIDLTEMVM